MDANAQYELYLIKNELQGIIDELYSIAGGVGRDFEGIGNDKCANSIINTAKQYEVVKQKLNNMNLSAVTEEFAAKKRAEAEARARAEAQARAEAEAKAKAKEQAAKNNSSSKSNGSKGTKSNNILEDVFGWLFK